MMNPCNLKYGALLAVAVLLLSCNEGVQSVGEEGVKPAREVYVSFPAKASSEGKDTRALIYEEGEVYEIMYALFHNRKCVLHETKTLPEGKYHTGGDPYKLPGVDDRNLDVNSEIFVIANPTEQMKTDLNGVCDDPSKTDEERYLTWKNRVHDGDLNTESAVARSRSIDRPLMAGYLHLKSDAGAVVVVPAEHIYSRIWCYFEWRNVPEATLVTVDNIVFKYLRANTRLFNTATDGAHNNLGEDEARRTEWTIENHDAQQQPFFGELFLDKDQPPYHEGESPCLLMTPQSRLTHNAVCRYTWDENDAIDMMCCPLRYYIYSYEWAGTTSDDDVEIVVSYHFTNHEGELVRKRASARLYDETYFPGKRHHGLLRNYTYRLRCIINTTVDVMDVQVTSHPWYKVTVDDIPPFE